MYYVLLLSNCKISTIIKCASLKCKPLIFIWNQQVNSFSFTCLFYHNWRCSVPLTDIIRQSLPQKHLILKVLLCETEPDQTIPKIAKHGYNLIYLMKQIQLKHYFLTGYMCLFTIYPYIKLQIMKAAAQFKHSLLTGCLIEVEQQPYLMEPCGSEHILDLTVLPQRSDRQVSDLQLDIRRMLCKGQLWHKKQTCTTGTQVKVKSLINNDILFFLVSFRHAKWMFRFSKCNSLNTCKNRYYTSFSGMQCWKQFMTNICLCMDFPTF